MASKLNPPASQQECRDYRCEPLCLPGLCAKFPYTGTPGSALPSKVTPTDPPVYLLFPHVPHTPLEAASSTHPSTVLGFYFLWHNQQMASLNKLLCPLIGFDLQGETSTWYHSVWINCSPDNSILYPSFTVPSLTTKHISFPASVYHI